MPADFMACRSARMPSLDTAACIQYQNTQGLAAAGGWRKDWGSRAADAGPCCDVARADCREMTCAEAASGILARMLIHSRITDRIVMIVFKCHFILAGAELTDRAFFAYGTRFAFKVQRSLAADGV